MASKRVAPVSSGTTLERNGALRAMAAVAKRSNSFRPARETLQRVRVVPTQFVQYDHALRVGGHPLQRITTVHGPSAHGKTSFALGLGASFLRKNHFFLHLDVEMTTPFEWLETLLGADLAGHPGFLACRPANYETAVDAVREFVADLTASRRKGDLPEDTTALIVVDSLRKLVPAGFFKKIAKEGAEGAGVDGYGGRAAQMRAALNAAWLDELVPMMHESGAAILFIARESEDPNADARSRMFGQDYKVGGGKAVVYDSSLLIRVERVGYVSGPGAADEKKPVYGERHRITVRKSKVAGKSDKTQVAFFHTSNGEWIPEGFDRARDLLELGLRFGLVKSAGTWLAWGAKKWQGEHKFVKDFAGDPTKLGELEAEVRGTFEKAEVLEVSEEDEGVVE